VSSRIHYSPTALIVAGLTASPYGSPVLGIFLAFAIAYLLVGLYAYVVDTKDRTVDAARNRRDLEREERDDDGS
jgi:hypothetical protein